MLDLIEKFRPATEEETLRTLRQELKSPSMLRKPKGTRDIETEILLSCFAAFVYSSAEERMMHQFFDDQFDKAPYQSSYYRHLQATLPSLFDRSRVMDVLHVAPKPHLQQYVDLRRLLLAQISDSYNQLNNFGHFAVYIHPLRCDGRNVTWELASDVMLYAEKLHTVQLKAGYFQSHRIEALTVESIPNLILSEARFDLVNEGFTYRDSFVMPPRSSAPCGDEAILVIFQKNRRDETPIPCPTCRSSLVRGNSYSTEGVRSWECFNPLCPDRSKYNRGKRYSFKSILTKEAIENVESQIPVQFVRSWARDVQPSIAFSDCMQMLIRHYTLSGDTVHIFGCPVRPSAFLGRHLVGHPLYSRSPNSASFFEESPSFRRYCVSSPDHIRNELEFRTEDVANVRIVLGDAAGVLASLDERSLDGAVTSPPYYNAKQYSNWPNIYAYLNEMLRIVTEMFRVLKPGSFFLYNIFDYFDNENSVVFSAMGNKRLILSAYTVDLFRRVGFVVLGNVTWDKGHIEGRRGFNGGNFSPYYQSPFNCWEHVLVFWKPDGHLEDAVARLRRLPSVLRVPPVSKMRKGVNSYGHDAPFPASIPQLILPLLRDGATVVDPFAGSGTTGRALAPFVRRVICIEKDADYWELARRMCSEANLGDELLLSMGEVNRGKLFQCVESGPIE